MSELELKARIAEAKIKAAECRFRWHMEIAKRGVIFIGNSALLKRVRGEA